MEGAVDGASEPDEKVNDDAVNDIDKLLSKTTVMRTPTARIVVL